MLDHFFAARKKSLLPDVKRTDLKVDVAIFVHVECTKDVITKFLGVTGREEHFVHVDEFRRSESSVGTVLLKSE